MNHEYSYQSTLTASEAIHWRIEDLETLGNLTPKARQRVESISQAFC